MPLFARKALVLAKIETTPGTDSVPVVGTDAMLCRNVNLRPLVTQTADRALLRGYLGSSDQLVVGEYTELELEIEAAGAGTSAATPPAYRPLMRACGLAGAVNGATSYDFTPISAAFEAVTLYVFMDGVRHVITGARGTARLVVAAGEIPVYRFRLLGMYNTPTDVTPGAATFTGFQTPVGIRDSAVPTLTVHGIAKATAPIRSFEFDLGNNLVYRNLIGSTSALITGRESAGSIEMEAVLVATKDWWTAVRNATTAAISVAIGSVATNIVELVASKVQLTEPQYGEQDGIVMLTMGMRFLPSGGNDEVTLRTK